MELERDEGDDGDAVEALLAEALERLESDGERGLESLLAANPGSAPTLRRLLARLGGIGLAPLAAGSPRAPELERLGDFRLLERLGQGGMGVVYRAVEESLGREVALKLIRPDQLELPGARGRFQREIEIVARMQHPGIVPVHSVGSADGVPYFAMELVRGASLGDVLADLEGLDPRTLDGRDLERVLARRAATEEPGTAPLFRGTWPTVVLRIVREVAEALEHAHRRGVLHRDVKPSNVMLTRGGRVLLVDFGLANARGNARLTRTGSQLGSLAYMAPERLGDSGGDDVGELDARADVYALGVTLYEMLALRLPYPTADPARLHALASAGTRARLSELDPAITWDVETVVATALEPGPKRRYASAALFARDLDNALGHRPIDARRASAALRLRRWSQRHPVRATAGVACALALILGPTVYAWQAQRAEGVLAEERDKVVRANAGLEAANVELGLANSELGLAISELEQANTGLADANFELGRTNAELALARDRARRSFAQLLEAVDTMLTEVGDETLRDAPRMEAVRRELLAEALRFYEGFLAEHPDDPALAREAAEIDVRRAEVLGQLGDYAAADESLAAALRRWRASEAALGALPADSVPARIESALARIARLRGRLPEGRAAAERAVALWQRLSESTSEPSVALGLGEARLERSQGLVDAGDLAGATAELERSIPELERARELAPASLEIAAVLARTSDRLAVGLCQQAWKAQAAGAEPASLFGRSIAEHERARDLWVAVLAARPHDTQARLDLQRNRGNVGLALLSLGRDADALPLLREATELGDALARDFPDTPRLQATAAGARTNLAAALDRSGARAEAMLEHEQAADAWQRLSDANPENDEHALGLASSLQGLVLIHWDEDAERASTLLARASAAVDRALAVRPQNPTYRRVRQQMTLTEAELDLARGRHGPAARAARELSGDGSLSPLPVLGAALLARCGALAAEDEALTEAERRSAKAGYREEALALLRNVVRAGVGLDGALASPLLAGQTGDVAFQELLSDFAAESGAPR